jgi:hypothetical protein
LMQIQSSTGDLHRSKYYILSQCLRARAPPDGKLIEA